MKASGTLTSVVRWRWMPFVALVAGSLFVVLLAVLLVPDRIGDAPAASLRAPVEGTVIDTQAGAQAPSMTARGAPARERPIAIAPSARGSELIDQLCAAFLKCNPQGPTLAECQRTNYRQREAAVANGCEAQFEAATRCMAGLASTCSLNNAQENCGSQTSALEKCSPGLTAQ